MKANESLANPITLAVEKSSTISFADLARGLDTYHDGSTRFGTFTMVWSRRIIRLPEPDTKIDEFSDDFKILIGLTKENLKSRRREILDVMHHTIEAENALALLL